MSPIERQNTGAYYPVFLALEGKTCLVVGGGAVAWRKVRALLECGASVIVVSPALCPGLKQMADLQQISARVKEFAPEDVKDVFLVIAATDKNDVNEQVARAARERKIPVNVVDDARLSDFILPAVLRRGELTIAISTSGKSPALARKLRDQLERYLGPEYAALTDLVAEVRSEMKAGGITVSEESWQKALDLELLAHLLKTGERGKAKILLQMKLSGPVDV